MTDDEIAKALAVELAWKAHGPMEVVLRPITVFQLVGALQLALRHPNVPPDVRIAVERFIAGAREYFADCHMVLDIIRRGDDPREDR